MPEESCDKLSIQLFEPKLVCQKFDKVGEYHFFGSLVVWVVFEELCDRGELHPAHKVLQECVLHLSFSTGYSALKILSDIKYRDLLGVFLTEVGVDLQQSTIGAHFRHQVELCTDSAYKVCLGQRSVIEKRSQVGSHLLSQSIESLGHSLNDRVNTHRGIGFFLPILSLL